MYKKKGDFDSDYAVRYKENKTDFDTVRKDVTALFGLKTPNSIEQPESLVLTQYEYDKKKEVY